MIKVAMIGVGAISGIYLKNLTLTFQEAELIEIGRASCRERVYVLV